MRAIGADGVPAAVPVKKHSKYRGVTKHPAGAAGGESHIWIKETGKQMYLGGVRAGGARGEAYDVAALKIKETGPS